MKINLLKTLGLARLLHAPVLRDPLLKAVAQAEINRALDAARPALKSAAADALGALPHGHLYDQAREDAVKVVGQVVDNWQVIL